MKVLFLLFIITLSIQASRVQLETGTIIPNTFTSISRAPIDAEIDLTFALKVSEEGKRRLKDYLIMVSDPEHERYGEYLEVYEVTEMIGVPVQFVRMVEKYLYANGVEGRFSTELHGTALVATMSVGQAERILETEFFKYCHGEFENYCLYRATGYTVDESLASVVDFVAGVLHFPAVDRFLLKKTEESKERLALGWTPRGLRTLFGTSSASPIKGSGNRQGVASFLGQYYDEPDLQEFFALFYQSAIGSSPSNVIGTQGLLPGVEANLDVQYIMATSDLVDTWVYSNEGYHEGQEPFLKWLGLLANTSNSDIPKTFSVSYGDDENSIEAKYMGLCDIQFQALGARGISVMFASGDSGASCTGKGDRFLPGWPATSPWVTAVGGTVGGRGDLEGDYISGGGFSDVFTMEKYQEKAVSSYIAAAKKAGVLPSDTYFNSSNRGFPDVGSPSEGFLVVSYLIPSPVGGTSAACPSFTSVISLLNEIQLSKNKPSLGFLNPWLYTNAKNMMQQVNSGCNGGCSSNGGTGFCATKDQGIWSPVSGLGVPDFQKMVQHLP